MLMVFKVHLCWDSGVRADLRDWKMVSDGFGV